MLLLTSEETRRLTDSLNEWNLGEQTELYTCLRKTNITPGKRQSLVLIRKLTWSRNVAISCNIGRCFRPRIGLPADIICMAYTLCDDSAVCCWFYYLSKSVMCVPHRTFILGIERKLDLSRRRWDINRVLIVLVGKYVVCPLRVTLHFSASFGIIERTKNVFFFCINI